MNDITPKELAAMLANGESIVLIDVRETYEWDAGHLDAAQHIPLSQLQNRIAEIPKDRDVVMICRSGSRSDHAKHFLAHQGYTRVRNLLGGMLRWSRDVV